ncbi:MAG: NADH:flavin oxidoreductase/NADH oxidase family protein [Myxococcota bacterium]
MTDALSQPLPLTATVTLPNRIGKGAMSENIADESGAPSDLHTTLYRRWGEGGAGMLITGNVIVHAQGRTEPHNVLLEDDRHQPMLRRWAEAAQANGSKLFMQINHAGRQTMRAVTWEPVGPSAIPVQGRPGMFSVPRPLTDAEIESLVQRYAFVASQAHQAGFAGAQIHGAHGYLVSQFLSPRTNQRTDRWGGSIDNRMRFLLEIAKAMRAATSPDFALSVKLNSADFQRGGFSAEDSVLVAQALEAEGINLLEISGGSYEKPAMMGARASTRAREAYFLEYAETMRQTVKMPLMVTGGFRTRAGMLEARATGAVDVVGIARPFAVDPDLANKLLAGSDVPLDVGQPALGVRALDDLLQLFWYQAQMRRMAAGEAPHSKGGRVGALVRNISTMSKHIVARRFRSEEHVIEG